MPDKRILGFANFAEFATEAMDGRRPYPYQQRLAAEGLPELLSVPTGAGKTAAGVLPWLWRRMSLPDSAQDRLVYVLPLRSLAEQAQRQITAWLERLGLASTIPVAVLCGGDPGRDDEWRLSPHQPAILLGTQDMIMSRLLSRGYGEWRSSWPVTFGLLHSGSQFVFDGTELLGPALGTSLQLQGLREALGSAEASATMWMSAIAVPADLVTPSRDGPASVVELGAADLADTRLVKRLAATRQVRRVALPTDPGLYPVALAGALAAWHVPGTATIAVLNTTERACAVYDALEGVAHAAERVLLHARFRAQERSIAAALAGARLPAAGRIVVATQAIEAGMDVSCQTMFTESAPWPSLAVRAGRCNRAGGEPGAMLLWSPPPAGRWPWAPYDAKRVTAAEEALAALESAEVTPMMLREHDLSRERPAYQVLTRADLCRLFDTAPEIARQGGATPGEDDGGAPAGAPPDGAGPDVTPWIRDGDDLTALVAWRFWPDGRPASEEPAPGRDELCPAPLAALRRDAAAYWISDQSDGGWRSCQPADIRSGAILLTDAAHGGYLPGRGWSPGSRSPVPAVMYPHPPVGTALRNAPAPVGAASPAGILHDPLAGPDAIDRDQATFTGAWVELCVHLSDAEDELRALTSGRCCPGLTPDQLEAAALAARFHDLGKAFRHFQDYLRGSAAGEPPPGGPWAKSPGRGGRHTARPFLRHELVTALALLHPRCRLLDGFPEPDLVVYLAAAHHGKVRMRAVAMPGEASHDPPRILGVEDGDELPAVTLPHGAHLAALTLDTRLLHAPAGSWAARTAALLDRPDLGPFRLAYLEALVRIADWRASRHPSTATTDPALTGPAQAGL
jgi:CRISPR-associated endonuclease/helicase Cas3